MSLRLRTLVAAVVATVWCQAAASADVIFDNTAGGNHGITTTVQPQLGGEVTAAPGTSRSVSELDIGFTSQGVAATANLQVFLYANDGPAGAPGTLLWQSAVMSGVSINSTNLLIVFSVPSVTVPDTFSWTAAITNPSVVVGYVPASGATTGTFVQPWVGSPGSWSALPPVFETEARIITGSVPSVPEPSVPTLLAVGLASIVLFGRFRRSAPSLL